MSDFSFNMVATVTCVLFYPITSAEPKKKLPINLCKAPGWTVHLACKVSYIYCGARVGT